MMLEVVAVVADVVICGDDAGNCHSALVMLFYQLVLQLIKQALVYLLVNVVV